MYSRLLITAVFVPTLVFMGCLENDGAEDAKGGAGNGSEKVQEATLETSSDVVSSREAMIQLKAWKEECSQSDFSVDPSLIGFREVSRTTNVAQEFDGTERKITEEYDTVIISVEADGEFTAHRTRPSLFGTTTYSHKFFVGKNGGVYSAVEDWVSSEQTKDLDTVKNEMKSDDDLDTNTYCSGRPGRSTQKAHWATLTTADGNTYQGLVHERVTELKNYECKLVDSSTNEVLEARLINEKVKKTETSFYTDEVINPFQAMCPGAPSLFQSTVETSESGEIFRLDKRETVSLE